MCPFDSKRLNVGAGYQSLADNIMKFHELRLMPEGIKVCIENLDEGSGIGMLAQILQLKTEQDNVE